MPSKSFQDKTINQFLSFTADQKIRQFLEKAAAVQEGVYILMTKEESGKLTLLKAATVFQVFLIDVLAAGKKPGELTKSDWKNIADKVYRYAVLEDGQKYSEFVFTMYANYIDLSAEMFRESITEKKLSSIKELSATIRDNTEKLKNEEIDEVQYVENCLWLSLEAMMKLLCICFTRVLPQEYADFVQSVPQLAFEYGRYVLYSREQELLDKYIQNQHALDEQLQKELDLYMEEVRVQAEAFQKLITDAFSPAFGEALRNSAALARAAGVKEEDILTDLKDVDAFFLE